MNVSPQQKEENAGVWGGGDKPVAKKTKEQLKKEDDLRESAFEGELDEVRRDYSWRLLF